MIKTNYKNTKTSNIMLIQNVYIGGRVNYISDLINN